MLADFDPSASPMPETNARGRRPVCQLSTTYRLFWYGFSGLQNSQDPSFNDLVARYNNHMTSNLASALEQLASRTEASRYATLWCGFFRRVSHHNLHDRPPRSDAMSIGS